MASIAAKRCEENRHASSSIVHSSDGSSSSNEFDSTCARVSASSLRGISAPVGEKPEKTRSRPNEEEPQQDKELRSVFDSVDEDGDGRITNFELASFMKKLNLAGSTDHIQSILDSADGNGDGVLEYDEFVKLYHSLKRLDCEETHAVDDEQDLELLDAFKVFDSNKDGFISPSELQTVVQCFSFGKRVKDCSHMIKAVDKDGDGLVNFQEFKEMMLSNFLL